MSTKNNRKRPEYTLEFKQDAAKLVNEKGYTHQQAADSLGISLSAIGRWVRAERGTATASIIKKTVLPLNDQAELVRLRKENERLRMEREILIPTRGTRKGHRLLCQGNRMKYVFASAPRGYSGATEDLPSYRLVCRDASEH